MLPDSVAALMFDKFSQLFKIHIIFMMSVVISIIFIQNLVPKSNLILNLSRDVTVFVRYILFVTFRLLHFVRSFYFVRFVTGGNVLLPHFSCRVLYGWLYSLWNSVM